MNHDRYQPLFEPLKVGAVVVKNRVAVTGHATRNLDSNGHPNEQDAAYFGERAKGGTGLNIMGMSVVHPSSPTPHGVYRNLDDTSVQPYAAVVEAVHEHDAVLLAQIGHMGTKTGGAIGANWAPSAISFHSRGVVPHVMSLREIRSVVDAHAAAALRLCRAGVDGVELSFGHGLLPNLFLSPLTNTRTDEYGGTPERRFAFVEQLLAEVRLAIGDRILSVRVNGSDEVDGGLTQDQWLSIDQKIDRTGAVDLVNVSASFMGSATPTMASPPACLMPYAEAVRRVVSIPVLGAGRVTDASIAAEVVASGQADLVGMTRAHIADPHLVLKISTGRADDVRPCVGCLQMCMGELERGRNVKCMHNAVTGYELTRRRVTEETAPSRRRVVVVGAGPAGMEAARISAIRGHEVILFEQRTDLGGAVRIAASVPGRSELAGTIVWLESQVRKLNIDIRENCRATGPDIMNLRPDVVVVATGARPATPDWLEEPNPRVTSAREFVSAGGTASERIVIVDDERRGLAFSAALVAAKSGAKVSIVTANTAVGDWLEQEVRVDFVRALRGYPVTVIAERAVRHCYGAAPVVLDLEASTGSWYARPEPGKVAVHRSAIEADLVVHTWSEPHDELTDLEDEVEVYRVGDAASPHRIEGAIHMAFLAAGAI